MERCLSKPEEHSLEEGKMNKIKKNISEGPGIFTVGDVCYCSGVA